MKKKHYEKPTMEVVQLKHQTHLLQASGQGYAGMQDYNWNNEDPE